MRSFRTKLSFLLVLVAATVIVAFGISGTVVTRKLLLRSVDLQLTVPADRILREMHPRANLTRVSRNIQIIHGEELENGSLSLAVWNYRDGELSLPIGEETPLWLESIDAAIWKDRPFEPPTGPGKGPKSLGPDGLDDLLPPPLGLDSPKGKGPGPRPSGALPPHDFLPSEIDQTYGFVEFDSSSWRFCALASRGYTVIIARELSGYRGEMRRVLSLLFVATPLALVLIGLGGYFVANRAIAPLGSIVQTADSISARDLRERIPIERGESEEFAELIRVLNGMINRLERGFSHATRFSSDVSHELKTPITIMQVELDSAIKSAPPDSPALGSLQSIDREVARLKSIISSLMLLSQAESGRLEVNFEKASLTDLINDLIEDAEILCEAESLELRPEVSADIEVSTDAGLLNQALLNLVSNAVKYNSPGGWVRISLQKADSAPEALIQISNSGPGIPEGETDLIFERFHRVDKSRSREVDGFGLGLSLAEEIASILRGELRLLEATKTQTLFELRLPLNCSADFH
ncbi:MAG: ATP-binding protein [Verrucomicrobiota bacterium]